MTNIDESDCLTKQLTDDLTLYPFQKMDETMGDSANDSPGHEPLEQMSSHLDNVKVKEEVRVKKEFKLNDLEGQRRSAFMTYKVRLRKLQGLVLNIFIR